MNKMLKVILPVMLISVLLIAGCSGESESDISGLSRITGYSVNPAQSPQLGEPAPDFQFQDSEGQTTSLSDFRGEVVLVNFWATWCGPCVYEMPFIQQVYDEWRGKGLVVLTINIGESANKATSFMEEYSLSFPVLLDTSSEVAQRYNVQYIPTTFFIDEDGIIQHIEVGAFPSKEAIESILSQLGITK